MKLAVVVTPKSNKDSIEGWRLDAAGNRELSVRVKAVPEDGKATKQVCKVIAKSLGVPQALVACVRGGASRHKQLDIDVDEETFHSWGSQFPDC